MDPRILTFADILVNYSSGVKAGDKVLIQCYGLSAKPLVKALVRKVYEAGGYPMVDLRDTSITREINMGASEESLEYTLRHELNVMKDTNIFIGINASDNIYELSDVPLEKSNLIAKKSAPLSRERIENTKWVVLRYPNESMAQACEMSLDSFEDFYFRVCCIDYEKMSRAQDRLVKYMQNTDRVHIKGPGTDISFSIKDITVIKDDGRYNMPGGEVATAPVKDSVQGIVSFNTPAVFKGIVFENIVLEFENGKIVKATSNYTEKLNKILDIDEGARYIGEFALGLHPHIRKPMKDVLFDEKISGSFHMALGNPYAIADNSNRSAIHWDIVCIQTPEYGGGEIYFDDVLVRSDGLFVPEELQLLNPENLA